MGNKNVLNSGLLENLKKTVLDKMENDEIVDISSVYCIFLPKKNKFIICKEDKFKKDKDFHLAEFFTNECVEFGEIQFCKIFYQWRETGRHFSWHFNDMIFCVSLLEFIGKDSICKVTSKKDLANLYWVVNDYLQKNPKYIKQLLDNEKKKIR